MSSKFFYGMFAFTLAFLLGLIGYWSVNKQYVSASPYHNCPSGQKHACPKMQEAKSQSAIIYNK